MCSAKGHVRFTPKSGLLRCTSACPLWANSGHPFHPAEQHDVYGFFFHLSFLVRPSQLAFSSTLILAIKLPSRSFCFAVFFACSFASRATCFSFGRNRYAYEQDQSARRQYFHTAGFRKGTKTAHQADQRRSSPLNRESGKIQLSGVRHISPIAQSLDVHARLNASIACSSVAV